MVTLGRTVGNVAVDRGGNGCVTAGDAGHFKIGLGLSDLRIGGSDLGIEHRQLLARRRDRRLGRAHFRLRRVCGGERLLGVLPGATDTACQGDIACLVSSGEGGGRPSRDEDGFSLGDRGTLGCDPRIQFRSRSRLCLYHRRSAGLAGFKIGRIDTDNHLTGADELIVRHRDVRDEARHMGGNRGHITPDIGIVGCLNEATREPPVQCIDNGENAECENEREREHADIIPLAARMVWPRSGVSLWRSVAIFRSHTLLP